MKNQVERGKANKLVGQGKEFVGVLMGDSALELEGDRQQAEGEAQESLGTARRKVRDLLDKAAKTLKK